MSPGKNRTRVKLLASLIILGFCVGVVFFADSLLMRTRYASYRKLLRDVDHRPRPDKIEFNSDGIRDAREASAFSESDFNIIFLGDSFVHGLYVYPREALPQQFEAMLRERYPDRDINVANFGWISASPYLELRQLRQLGGKYHPDLVILCIDMTDISDDMRYEFLNERPGVYRLLDVLPSAVFLAKDLAARFGFHESVFGYPDEAFFMVKAPLEETRKYFAHIQKNIDEIEAFTRSDLGAGFLLVILPRYYQYSMDESPKDWQQARHRYTRMGPYVMEPFRYFEEMRERVDYPVYSLQRDFLDSPVFPKTFFKDPHWTPAGSRVAAEAILRIVLEENLL